MGIVQIAVEEVENAVAKIEEPVLAAIPLWRELFTGIDYAALKLAPVYYGFGAPRGDGSAVVIVPGFLGVDAYLFELHWWLQRIGYRSFYSGIGHNAECPDILSHRLLRTVNAAYKETGRPVHLVGHSLGGVLSRGVASIAPARVASVTMLGSPFRGVRINPWVAHAVKLVRRRVWARKHRGEDCFTTSCACGFTCAMRDSFPDHILETAIFTKSDGVVDWETAATGNPQKDFEVGGTHIGLVWNPAVYRVLSKRLAEASRASRALSRKARRARRAMAVAPQPSLPESDGDAIRQPARQPGVRVGSNSSYKPTRAVH